MSAKFIKLDANTDRPTWVSVERIAFIGTYDRQGFPQWNGLVAFSGAEDDYVPVSESPEEILALIEGAKP